MKAGYTHVSLLLDRSGSMDSIKNDVIGGFNSFLEAQKLEPGELTISFSQFDTDYDELTKFVPINQVQNLTPLTFQPRGGTALLKFATKLINDTGAALKAMKEEDRPEKVLFVMITDGEENSSNDGIGGFQPRGFSQNFNDILQGESKERYTNEKLKALTTHQTEKYNWQFIYIGANQDSFATGSSIGTSGVNYSADTKGTGQVFRAMSASLTSYRNAPTMDSAGNVATFSLSQDDVDNA